MAAALAKVQGKLKPVALDTINPFFKSEYASYQACRMEAQPHLAEAGLAVSHFPVILPDGRPALECILSHSSGQFICGVYPLNPVKNDPQSLGSATTYAKRYSFKAMVGIFDKEDDDGNAATHAPRSENHAPASAAPRQPVRPAAQAGSQKAGEPPGDKPKPKPGAPTDKQLARLWAIASAAGWTKSGVKVHCEEKWGISSSKDLNRAQYDELCDFIEKNPAEDIPSDDPGDDGGPYG